MQLALLWFGLANTILQCMMSAKFSAAIRRQCLLIATVSTVLDLLVHFNVDPGLEGGASMEENTSLETMNPFAAFMGAATPYKTSEKEKKTENEEEGEGPEAIDVNYLKRARSDMTAITRGRMGQMLALITISWLCGAKTLYVTYLHSQLSYDDTRSFVAHCDLFSRFCHAALLCLVKCMRMRE